MGLPAAFCLFVYGTFLADEVLLTLLGRVPQSATAVIRDYRRYAIIARSYPAALEEKGYEVEGRVLFGLSETEAQLLDEFEGPEYIRTTTEAFPYNGAGPETKARKLLSAKALSLPRGVASVPRPCNASVYAWSDPEGSELQGAWEYEEWRREHLDSFLAECRRFIDGRQPGRESTPAVGSAAGRAEDASLVALAA